MGDWPSQGSKLLLALVPLRCGGSQWNHIGDSCCTVASGATNKSMSDSSEPKTSAALRRARVKAAAATNHREVMTTLRMLLLKMDHVDSKLDSCEHKVELATAGLALLANKELAAMPSMPVSLLEPAIDRQ